MATIARDQSARFATIGSLSSDSPPGLLGHYDYELLPGGFVEKLKDAIDALPQELGL
ncbi:hypothetical protein TRAPUB_6644 [Trametes pubescens]|uniref:Uncharacterized protein n=1 Tax=Trametes pubescens TaxID=154538 RepID=A0A1M2V5C8_TRAPU|nr:hypothetical protein TRAPUB_6644 [Trametes pubescens]